MADSGPVADLPVADLKLGESSDEEEEDGVTAAVGGAASSAADEAKRKKKAAKKKAAAKKKKEAAKGGAAAELDGGADTAAAAGAGGPPVAPGGAASSAAGAGGKAVAPSGSVRGVPSIPPAFRGVKGFVDGYVAVGQTHPPSIPVSKLFPSGSFPVGEIQSHPGEFNSTRETSEERRHVERLSSDLYDSVREAAEVHRHVRKFAQGLIRPGIKLADSEWHQLAEGARPPFIRPLSPPRSVLCIGGHEQAARRRGGPRPRHRLPDGLQPEPRRGALHAQPRRRHSAAVRGRHEGGVWGGGLTS